MYHKIIEMHNTLCHIKPHFCHEEMADLCCYVYNNLDELTKLKDYQLAGNTFATIARENIDGNIPYIAYYCFNRGSKLPETWLQRKYNEGSTAGRLRLIMTGCMEILNQIAYDFNKPPKEIIDIAILSDVIKLKSINYCNADRWWSRVQEDANRIRLEYSNYTDDYIIRTGEMVHDVAAKNALEHVKKWLDTL